MLDAFPMVKTHGFPVATGQGLGIGMVHGAARGIAQAGGSGHG